MTIVQKYLEGLRFGKAALSNSIQSSYWSKPLLILMVCEEVCTSALNWKAHFGYEGSMYMVKVCSQLASWLFLPL